MAYNRCLISLVVNGQRWLDEGVALASQPDVPRAWSLCGLQDFVLITVGAKLGFTLDNMDWVEQRWCRAKPNAGDAEAVRAGFVIASTPHVTGSDPGAGLSLEAVEIAATTDTRVIVTVGSQINWLPMRQKLESRSIELFELLLPAAGKVVVATERVIDIREFARQHVADEQANALFRAPPAHNAAVSADGVAETLQVSVESLAGNAVRGTVKSLANGYGMIKRNDGMADVQFMAMQVTAPGFEFLELGDELRFDVVQGGSGKWLAQRVVRT